VNPADLVDLLRTAGHPTCYVDLPSNALGDVQTSAEYVVWAVRSISRRAGRSIALYGHSQGGLLTRWALTYWPSLRRKVADTVTVAATNHGTTWASAKPIVDNFCVAEKGCPPALWQQRIGSKLLAALNNGRDETPGPTAWTTIRTNTDDIVQPQKDPRPTSALKGASNVLIQRVCPGRTTTHGEARVDSVAYIALLDALRHRGPSNTSRFPKSTCRRAFAPGVDGEKVRKDEQVGLATIAERVFAYKPQATREPAVRAYARRDRS
jgi:hypothetical protein